MNEDIIVIQKEKLRILADVILSMKVQLIQADKLVKELRMELLKQRDSKDVLEEFRK